jgi:hypothetical protein
VACGISIIRVLAQPFNLAYCYRDSPVSLKQYYATIGRPLVAAVMSGVLLWIAYRAVYPYVSPRILRLGFATAAMAALYLVMFMLVRGGRKTLTDLLATARELLRSRRTGD